LQTRGGGPIPRLGDPRGWAPRLQRVPAGDAGLKARAWSRRYGGGLQCMASVGQGLKPRAGVGVGTAGIPLCRPAVLRAPSQRWRAGTPRCRPAGLGPPRPGYSGWHA
jgi:hypothetical protein